ncbi:MAG TPA: GreA/GreB family elongation factor [Candidatus Saccharimonadales bacterium]|nr:GreA/GreB family elongation factor [Candidatus Saccharimonadales bacterium]
MSKQYHYVSESGLKALSEQLDAYKNETRELRAKLVELRQSKDVEDFDLIDDTIRLNFLDKEIERTKDMIAHAKLWSELPADGTVQIGSVVRLQPEGVVAHGEMSCMLVSSLEANPDEGKISDKSPLGIALLGKMKNAIVKVTGPRKSFSYRIVGVDSQAATQQ